MSERDKKAYWQLKSDPAKYAAYLERKRLQRLAANRLRSYETERKRKWRMANPDDAKRIRKANHAVETALKNGKLVRPSFCQECLANGSVEGHHESYAPEHWLTVRWLCQTCHSLRHHPR